MSFRSSRYLSVLSPFAAMVLLAVLLVSFSVSGQAAASTVSVAQDSTTAPTTIITVTSGTDPDTSKSKTCYSGSSPTSPCTLRRAIVEARLLPAANRPILISFNIPRVQAQGYDSSLDAWKIHPRSTSDPSVFRRLEGSQITVDGTTQPGGRTDGPKIIIVGPSTREQRWVDRWGQHRRWSRWQRCSRSGLPKLQDPSDHQFKQ